MRLPTTNVYKASLRIAAAIAGLVGTSLLVYAQSSSPQEWLTWGGDRERTGWNRAETKLSKSNVARLELKWKSQIDQAIPVAIESGASMLTAPLVARGVQTARGVKDIVYTQSISNTLAALDVANGTVVWTRTFQNSATPANPADWICTNTSTATPVIDKASGIIYTIAADGRLYGLDIATGAEKMAPINLVPPYSRNWSLNLVDGVLYTTVGRGCGNRVADMAPPPAPARGNPGGAGRGAPPAGAPAGAAGRGAPPTGAAPGAPAVPQGNPPATARQGGAPAAPARGGRGGGGGGGGSVVAAHMVAIDLKDPARPISRFFTSQARPSGAWTRSGMAWGFGSLFVLTADGTFAPEQGLYGQTLLRLAPKTLALMDYFTPSNFAQLNTDDLDFSSGGMLAFTLGTRQLVVSVGKEGKIFLHDATSLGGADHHTPLFELRAGNDAKSYASNGAWGAPATMTNARNERWIYLPMWGPPSKEAKFAKTNGDAADGSIMAFQVVIQAGKPILVPKWVSRNLSVPDSPVIANGVVYAISTGENTLQRHTDPKFQQLYQVPGQPPPPTIGTMTAEERGQHVGNTVLYAFDAETGQELYSSKNTIDDWTHLSSISVVDGRAYVTTRKSILWAFGLRN